VRARDYPYWSGRPNSKSSKHQLVGWRGMVTGGTTGTTSGEMMPTKRRLRVVNTKEPAISSISSDCFEHIVVHVGADGWCVFRSIWDES
jgi:hypothetical protein